MPQGNVSRIVVSGNSLHGQQGASLIEKIAELVHDKRVEGITDIRDESDRAGMRIVIEVQAATLTPM